MKIKTILMVLLCFCLTGCDRDENECPACDGTGYYNAVNCPICHGEGEIDEKTRNEYYDTLERLSIY